MSGDAIELARLADMLGAGALQANRLIAAIARSVASEVAFTTLTADVRSVAPSINAETVSTFTLGGTLEIERGSLLVQIAEALRARGHTVAENSLVSGLQGIAISRKDGAVQLVGGADPRREGEAIGD